MDNPLHVNNHSAMVLNFLTNHRQSLDPSIPMDPILSQHPLLLHGEDEMIGYIVEALKIIITSPPEPSFLKTIKEAFRQNLALIIFGDQNILEFLKSAGELEINEKTICGKRLNQPGIYIRCLDCEKMHEVQSSLCPDCFENSNHEGHRVCIVNMTGGIAATCDCGDVSIINPEGSCPNHQAQEIDLKNFLKKIPTIFIERIQTVIKKTLYCCTSIYAMADRAKDIKTNKCLLAFADGLLDELIVFLKALSDHLKEWLTTIIGMTLQENFLEGFNKVWHNCDDFLADDDPEAVDVTQSHACKCSVFGNILRVGNTMHKNMQTKLSDFMLECIVVQSIKDNIGMEFVKYMAFLLCQTYSIDYPPEIILPLFSEILNMSGHIFMKESMMKELVDSNCIDILIQIVQKAIAKSTKARQVTNICVAYSIKIITTIFELQYPCAQTLVKAQTYQKKLFELLAQLQKKFYIEQKIDINTFSHEIDYIPMLCGTDTEGELIDTLGHFISSFCRFSQGDKLDFARLFMSQWYSEFLQVQENHIVKRNNSYLSYLPSLQRILCDFMMHYLNNSITSGAIKAVLNETLPDVKVNKLAEDTIIQTIQSFGLIRYAFIILQNFGNQIWPFERDLKFCIFEKDILTTQLLVGQIEPNALWRVLTENFFMYDTELSEFFTNPEILNTEDERYKYFSLFFFVFILTRL